MESIALKEGSACDDDEDCAPPARFIEQPPFIFDINGFTKMKLNIAFELDSERYKSFF